MGKLSRNDKMLKLLRNRKIMRSCDSFIGRGGAHLPPEREVKDDELADQDYLVSI